VGQKDQCRKRCLLSGKFENVKRLYILTDGWDPSSFRYLAKKYTGAAGWGVVKLPAGMIRDGSAEQTGRGALHQAPVSMRLQQTTPCARNVSISDSLAPRRPKIPTLCWPPHGTPAGLSTSTQWSMERDKPRSQLLTIQARLMTLGVPEPQLWKASKLHAQYLVRDRERRRWLARCWSPWAALPGQLFAAPLLPWRLEEAKIAPQSR
jgi:hypothetical protein